MGKSAVGAHHAQRGLEQMAEAAAAERGAFEAQISSLRSEAQQAREQQRRAARDNVATQRRQRRQRSLALRVLGRGLARADEQNVLRTAQRWRRWQLLSFRSTTASLRNELSQKEAFIRAHEAAITEPHNIALFCAMCLVVVHSTTAHSTSGVWVVRRRAVSAGGSGRAAHCGAGGWAVRCRRVVLCAHDDI